MYGGNLLQLLHVGQESSTGTYTNTNTRRRRRKKRNGLSWIYDIPKSIPNGFELFFLFVSYAFIDMNYSFSPIIKRLPDRGCTTCVRNGIREEIIYNFFGLSATSSGERGSYIMRNCHAQSRRQPHLIVCCVSTPK